MLFYSKKILYFTLFIYYTINSINNNLLPGVKLTLSQNALNYLKDVGMKILEQKLSTLSIPDLNGNESNYYFFFQRFIFLRITYWRY